MVDPSRLRSGRLVYGRETLIFGGGESGESSTEGETHLGGGGDSSTEGKIRPQCGDSYTEGETHVQNIAFRVEQN
jgi:hypothetical protein